MSRTPGQVLADEESTTADRSEPNRAFVLGLDGVPWGKLNAWIDEGHLPNFERLRSSGVAAPFDSTVPPTTALAWPSITTGVWPDTHGVYGFQRLESDYTHQMNTSRDVDHPALWDRISPAVVANVPMTYPAAPIDGALVTGMMTPEMNDRFTHPQALRTDVLEAIPDYEIGLTWSEYADRPEEFVEDLEALVGARRELMRLLMDREDWRLFFFVYTAPDRLQHLLWDDAVMIDHYQFLDDVLGEVMDYAQRRGANLFVVSDHGFGPVEKYVAVNRVLERAGYLARNEPDGVRGLFANLGVSKEDVLSALSTVGIDQETIVTRLPKGVVDTVAGQVPGSHGLYDVDFSRTRAFVHGTGCVFVNDTGRFEQGTVDPADRAAVKEAVADVLDGVTDPETGDQALRVFDGDEAFPADDASPDLVVLGKRHYNQETALEDEVVGPMDATQASHESEGIFFAWGPAIDADATLEGATVVDLAPTLLHSVGDPVPAAADGAVLTDILLGETEPPERTVTDVRADDDAQTDDDFEDVTERLRGLGYVE